MTTTDTMRFGYYFTSFGFDGAFDDFAIFESALDSTQVALLASGKYPAVDIDNAYTPFAVPANTAVSPSGTGRIPADAPQTIHRIDQTADVAFDTTLPTVPSLATGQTGMGTAVGYLPFEQVPGFVGEFGNGWRCASAATCPTAGVAAVNGRGAYLDGVNDLVYYDIGNGSETRDSGGVAMWVKPERGTIWSGTNGNQWWQLDMNALTGVSEFCGAYGIPHSLPANEWSHILVMKGTTYGIRYFVNGQLVGNTAAQNCGNTGGLTKIGDNIAETDKYKGYIDEVYVLGDNFAGPSEAEALAFYNESAPIFHFDFDEGDGALQFADRSGNQMIGTPTTISQVISGTTQTALNPAPGVDGKIGNVATFDGNGVITVDDPNYAVGNLTNDFTIMAWIKPTNLANENGFRAIMSPQADTSVNGFFFGTWGKKLTLSIYDVSTHLSTADVNDGIWQHVAMTMNSSNSVTFYINGIAVGSSTSAAVLANTDEPLYIGGRYLNGSITQAFQGSIDELSIYRGAQSANEISLAYLRDLRWYRDRGSQIITIDTDNPTVALIGNQTYYTNTYTMLAVETFDPTSNVTMLDFGIKGPSDSTFSWHGAPSCNDGTLGRTWCPSFNPATMGGEGRYQVQFRAVDQAGNETTSSVYDLYVDASAPTAASSHTSGSLTALTPMPNQNDSWTVALNGTVSDATLSGGFAGSGVISTTVLVGLRASDGSYLSANRQQVALNSTNWSVTFQILNEQPNGTYTIELQAADALGNQATVDVGSLLFDVVAPVGEIDRTTSPTIVTGTTVSPLVGTVDDPTGQGVQSVEVKLIDRSTDTGTARIASATGSWQAATVSGTDWSYAIPAHTTGFYEAQLRTTDTAGNTAEKGTQWRGIIDNANPVISTPIAYHIGGSNPRTYFEVTYFDFWLDTATRIDPCGANGTVTSTAYNAPGAVADGLVHQMKVTCELPGHMTTQQTYTICDGVGNCTTRYASNYGQAHTLSLLVDLNNDANLSWTQPSAGCLHISYRNDAPYFTPHSDLSIGAGYTNSQALGALSGLNDGYYKIIAISCASDPDSISNEVGIFSFNLTPGQ